jgi:hypothetical protein
MMHALPIFALVLCFGCSGVAQGSVGDQHLKRPLTLKEAQSLISVTPQVIASRKTGSCVSFEENSQLPGTESRYRFEVRAVNKQGCKIIEGSGLVGFFVVDMRTGRVFDDIAEREVQSATLRKRLHEIRSKMEKERN